VNEFETLQRRLSEGRIGRRDFIKRATALGLAAAIPPALLAAEAKAAAPKQGGKFRQALRGGSNADTLFGVLGGGDTHQVNTQWQILSNVTEMTPDGEVVGELAESWEVSDDATQWVFKLRKGVEFHDGKSLVADDVVHSINVHRGEDSRSIGKGLVAGVEGVKADDQHTVVFKLKTGNADFPVVLASSRFPIAPAGSMDAEWEKGIGTGPFMLSEWEPGVRSATKRNPNYFKEGKPYFDEVETLHVADVGARTSALRDGSVDAIDDPEPQTLHLLEQVPNLRIREVGGNSHYTFPMLMDTAPYDNVDVRYALNMRSTVRPCCRPSCAGTATSATTIPYPRPSAISRPNCRSACTIRTRLSSISIRPDFPSSTSPSGQARSMLAASIPPCSTRNMRPRRASTSPSNRFRRMAIGAKSGT
jgi:peptide/nickel transport system substrate-binding protein